MPVYFFHFTDGTNTYPDRLGMRHTSLDQARQYACRVARELGKEQYAEFYVQVVDDKGEEVARAYVTERH